MLKNSFFFSNILFFGLVLSPSILSINTIKIKPVSSNLNFIELSRKSFDLTHFTNNLREEHMMKISELQNYIVNFTQENLNTNVKSIQKTVKNYLKRLRSNVAKLNKSFNKEYNFCKSHLTTFNRQCRQSNQKSTCDVRYNNKYIKTLHTLDKSLERTISNFYSANILSTMKSLTQTCEKESIVPVLKEIMCKLDSHFNILTQKKLTEETKNVDVNNDKQLDSFLQRVIVKIHHHVIRVPKKNDEDEEQERQRQLREKFLRERREVAEILYNKANAYMESAIQRKKKLNALEESIMLRMRGNDEKINNYIHDLQNMRRENNNLIISLNKDNQETTKKVKKCEVLKNISTKCREMATIYQSILNSYDDQSEALERIFKIIKKKN